MSSKLLFLLSLSFASSLALSEDQPLVTKPPIVDYEIPEHILRVLRSNARHVYTFSEVKVSLQGDGSEKINPDELRIYQDIFDLASGEITEMTARKIAFLAVDEILRQSKMPVKKDGLRRDWALVSAIAPIEHGYSNSWIPQCLQHFSGIVSAIERNQKEITIHDCDECDMGTLIRLKLPEKKEGQTADQAAARLLREFLPAKILAAAKASTAFKKSYR